MADVQGIIFLVDAADRTRFEEAAEELGKLLDDPALARVPLAVLGNKIDIPVAASEDELRHSLGLYTHMTSGADKIREGILRLRLLRSSFYSSVSSSYARQVRGEGRYFRETFGTLHVFRGETPLGSSRELLKSMYMKAFKGRVDHSMAF